MGNEFDDEELTGPRRWWADIRQRWIDLVQTNGLVRHLVHEPSFLVALVALLICGLGVVVVIPKIWNASPPGSSRVVRVSLLDYIQAWNLRRTAVNAAAEGKWDEAQVAWRTAIVNNPADARLHRGTLGMLRDAPWVHSANLSLALYCGESLMELTGTNRADSGLIADVLVRHRMPDVAIEVLKPWEQEWTPAEESIVLRAWFGSGRIPLFESRWQKMAGRGDGDERLKLYRAALDAVGQPVKAVEGLERLRAALGNWPDRVEAARLICWAAQKRQDLTDYGKGLSVLRELGSAMVQDEVGEWQLLGHVDRRDDAVKAAREYRGVPPSTPMEAIQLVRAWTELGLGDLGVAMFKDHIARYGSVFEVWAAYFDLLMERRLWDEVRKEAAGLRANLSGRDDVVAMTWYAEAIADLSEGRSTAARTYLRRLKECTISSPTILLRLASGLIQAGEQEVSSELLQRAEPALGKQPDYWIQVIIGAQSRRDVDGMQRATERLLQISPSSLIGLNMKLGLMLLKRESSAEALTLSMRLTSGGGGVSSGAMINHAVALLQNARTAEAGAVLTKLDTKRLAPLELAAWQVAQVEFLGQSGRPGEAVVLGEKVDVSQLLPPDADWLAKYLVECRNRLATGKP